MLTESNITLSPRGVLLGACGVDGVSFWGFFSNGAFLLSFLCVAFLTRPSSSLATCSGSRFLLSLSSLSPGAQCLLRVSFIFPQNNRQ